MTSKMLRRANRALDERLGTQEFLQRSLDHIFPDNWSFMLGEIAFYCFLILVVTGVWLALFFDPSDTEVVYHGSYAPLRGVDMSLAYRSTVHLSLNVRDGLLIRQIHHWTADIFIAALACHLARVFFSGAFRRPRELNWMVGVTLLLLSVLNGFTGYSLPGDLLSGLGLRIAYSVLLSVPLVGSWLAFLFFGGEFPSSQLTHRLYISHVFVVPLLIFGLLGAHLAMVWHQKHTQFPGAGRSEKRLVGSPVYPMYALRSVALMLAVSGTVCLLGGLAQINPIWEYGPYHPYLASSFAQPDWYTAWLEGALRLMPPWRLHLWGWTVSEVFWPAVALPTVLFAVVYAYPWLEQWWIGDRIGHNLLDRPRDRPGRTAVGVAGFTFCAVLTVAGGQDVIGYYLDFQQAPVTFAFQAMVIGLPLLAALVSWRICRGLRGVTPEPVELPEGPPTSANPPSEPYLPERVAWQEAKTGRARDGDEGLAALSRRRRAAVAAGTALTACLAGAAGLRAGRRSRVVVWKRSR